MCGNLLTIPIILSRFRCMILNIIEFSIRILTTLYFSSASTWTEKLFRFRFDFQTYLILKNIAAEMRKTNWDFLTNLESYPGDESGQPIRDTKSPTWIFLNLALNTKQIFLMWRFLIIWPEWNLYRKIFHRFFRWRNISSINLFLISKLYYIQFLA